MLQPSFLIFISKKTNLPFVKDMILWKPSSAPSGHAGSVLECFKFLRSFAGRKVGQLASLFLCDLKPFILFP